MRSSVRTYRWSAVAVFAAIAGGVLGGIGWATVSSFELARDTIIAEHTQRISQAVWELTNYMAGILNSETARDETDYLAYHRAEPVAVGSGVRKVDLEVGWVLLRSPLISRTPYDWMDAYFHMDQDGTVSSPQVFDDAKYREWDDARTPVLARHRQTLDWLKYTLPQIDLREQVTCALRRAGEAPTGLDLEETDVGATGSAGASQQDRFAGQSRSFEQRSRALRDSQKSNLPAEKCVDAEIADWNMRSLASTQGSGFAKQEFGSSATQVGITTDPIVAFWLGVEPNSGRKLAFVRECHADESVFYQGFVGDWGRLKPRLLEQIADVYPDADLEAVGDLADGERAIDHAQMINLPVRLLAPGIPGGANWAAWSDVRGTVITTWIAALAVLAIAGWGLRNLVALTERRMQFAYAVTHELRTPLTTFRLYSDMLSAGLVPEESKQGYLDTLNTESIRLASLVEDVLDYARLENHKVKLNPVETDGSSLLKLVTETLNARCKASGVSPKAENQLANGQKLRTDVDLINRITGVLINNACRHARSANGASVMLRLQGQDDRVYLDVIDSGSGIDRSDARAIFKPFRRGHGADAAARGGIGLGLALARSWATLLGGRLELAARHDPELGGAHFRLTIPAQSAL